MLRKQKPTFQAFTGSSGLSGEGALSDACAEIAWLASNLPVALQNALHKFLREVAARR